MHLRLKEDAVPLLGVGGVVIGRSSTLGHVGVVPAIRNPMHGMVLSKEQS